MTADGTPAVFTISGDLQGAMGSPTGYDLNHLQSQLRASAVLLGAGLPGLLALPFPSTTWGPDVFLAFAIEPDQDGQGPVLVGSEGERDLEGKDHPVVPEGKEGPGARGTEGIMVHVGAPDVATRLAGQGIVDGADQGRPAEGQQ